MNGNSINFDEIDTSVENFTIEETEFHIEIKNSTEIHIEIIQNETTSGRQLFIGLQARNYFDRIIITQPKD